MQPYHGTTSHRNRRAARTSSMHRRQQTDEPKRSKYGQPVRRDGRLWWEKFGLNYTTHFFHKRNGWAIDHDRLQELIADGYAGVIIITDEGTEWSSTIVDWQSFASEPFAYGDYPEQVCLPVEYWTRTQPVTPTSSATPVQTAFDMVGAA